MTRNSFLGTVSPQILKKLKKIRPKVSKRGADTEIVPLSVALDDFVRVPDVPAPEWLGCAIANPHVDWDSYFLCVSVLGAREFGEHVDEDNISYLAVNPGTVFVVDGSKLHWLSGNGTSIPRGWWMGLQWELNPSRVDCPYVANQILDLLEVKRTRNKQDLSIRYHLWV